MSESLAVKTGRLLCMGVLAVVVAACARLEQPAPESENLAYLRWNSCGVCYVSIDDTRYWEYTNDSKDKMATQASVNLPPGLHEIRLQTERYVYNYYFSYYASGPSYTWSVKLQGARRYSIRGHRGKFGTIYHHWLEDEESEEALAGAMPPHFYKERHVSLEAKSRREEYENFVSVYENTKQLAETNDIAAQYKLATLYLIGIPPTFGIDRVMAYYWFGRASEGGFTIAEDARARLEASMSDDELEQARRLFTETEAVDP